jgi:membrane fusion protein (multidrug efflux system)
VKHKIYFSFLSVLFIIACSNPESSLETDIVVPVSVEDIKPGSIEQFISTTGTVLSVKEVTLKSQMSGNYFLLKNPGTGQPFKLGDFVNKDQEIILIEDEEYVNNLKIESLELNLDISKREFEKQQSLYEKGGVTLRELKNAEMEYINAQYNYDNAKIQLTKMKVKAPFNGVIVDLPYYTEGTKIETNLSVVTLMDYKQLYMEVNLSEKNFDILKVNQPARITHYTLPEDTLQGKITQLSPAIDSESRTFKAILLIDNAQSILRPGMFVKTDIIVDRKDSVIVIPKDIILSKQRGKTVFIVQRGAAMERVIITGLENPDEVEVIRGLRTNDRLIVDGFETLGNLSKVKVLQ